MDEVIFGAASVVASGSVSILILYKIYRRRYLILKPSMAVLAAYHLLIQWPFTLRVGEFYNFLPRPWESFILIHLFMGVGLALALSMNNHVALRLWSKIQRADRTSLAVPRTALIVVGGLSLAAVGLYLSLVPLTSTGLASILSGAESASQAREASLKLVGNRGIAYLYLFNAKVLAIAAASLATLRYVTNPQTGRVTLTAIVAFSMVGAALSGARSFAMFVLMASFMAYFLGRKLPVRLTTVALGAFSLLLIPSILSLVREGVVVTAESILQYMAIIITERMAGASLQNGIYHVHFAQTSGVLGMEGWPRFAALAGLDIVNIASVVMTTYYPGSPTTGFANTGFLFVYYSYFGLGALLFCPFLIPLLDLALHAAVRLSPPFAIALVIGSLIAALALVESEFTTVMISHGFLSGIFFITAIGRGKFCHRGGRSEGTLGTSVPDSLQIAPVHQVQQTQGDVR